MLPKKGDRVRTIRTLPNTLKQFCNKEGTISEPHDYGDGMVIWAIAFDDGSSHRFWDDEFEILEEVKDGYKDHNVESEASGNSHQDQ